MRSRWNEHARIAKMLAVIVVLASFVAVACFLLLRRPPSRSDIASIDPSADVGGDASARSASPAVDEPSLREADARRDSLGVEALASGPISEPPTVLRVELVDVLGERIDVPDAFALAYDEHGEELRPKEETPSVLVWTDLAPGRWWIQGNATGFEDEVLEMEVVESGGPIDRTLALARTAVVRITLLDSDGSPYVPDGSLSDPESRKPSVSVFVSRTRPEHRIDEVLELDDLFACGWLRGARLAGLELPHQDLIELYCSPPLYVNLVHELDVLDSQRWEPGVEELTFVVDPDRLRRSLATLRLRLVDAETRLPIPDPRLRLRTGRTGVRLFHRPDPVPEIVLRRLYSGPALMEVRPLGYESIRRELALEPGAELDLGEIELQPIGESVLSVELIWPSGLEDATICIANADDFRTPDSISSWENESLVQGEVLDLRPGNGRWVLWAEAETPAGALRSALHPADLTGSAVHVTLELAKLAPLFLMPFGEPREVLVLDSHGLAAITWKVDAGLVPTRVDVVPGRYRLLSREPHGRIEELAVDLGAAGASILLR